MRIFISLFVSIIFLTFIKCTEDCPDCPPQTQGPKGKLVVKSNPSAARIYLMGTDTGKNTPDSLINLEAGTYDVFLYLQYYDTAYFTAEVRNNLTTTKEITLDDGLPFVDIELTYSTSYGGDSVKFYLILNQDLLLDSIIVVRPISSAGNYTTDRYLFSKELWKSRDEFGNSIQYNLPQAISTQHFYPRFENFTYEFHFYGQKAYGVKTYFVIHLYQDV